MSKYVILEIEKQIGSNPKIKFNNQPLKISIYDKSINPLSAVAHDLAESEIQYHKLTDRDNPIETTVSALAPKELEEIGALRGLMIECSEISLERLKYIIIRSILYRCYPGFSGKYDIMGNLTLAQAFRRSDALMRDYVPSAIEPIEPYRGLYLVKSKSKDEKKEVA